MKIRKFAPRGLALLLGLLALPLAAPAPAASLLASVEIDHPVVFAGDARPVYLLVRLKAADQARRAEARPPLNLALVLDRSGSMSEAGKLEYLKTAAKGFVRHLAPSDWLAMVEYSDEARVAWPSSPAESPTLVASMIDGLTAGGNTNLAGGMVSGVAEVRRRFRASAINRVLLLSDGLANRGVTALPEIRALALDARRAGIPVTTLGLGLHYDENLMQAIAEASGGHYYYIEDPGQAAAIFQRELSILVETAARDVELRFDPSGAVRSVQVFGHVTRNEGGATVVALPDFFAGEERSLVLRLELEAGRHRPDGTEVPLGELRIGFENAAGDGRREESRRLGLAVSDDRERVRRAANRDVIVEAALVETEAAHAESLRLVDAGKWRDAEAKLDDLAADLEARNAEFDDVRLAKKVEALKVERRSVGQAAAAPASPAAMSYVKRSKTRLYEAKKGQRGDYMLQVGDSGPQVERLQRALTDAGAYDGPIDGRYTEAFAATVKRYQAERKLTQDGIAGPATLQTLGLY